MKIKFTKFERMAGLFVLTALLISLFSFIGVAIKKGWFSPADSFHTYLPSGEGLGEGTLVQMSGLRVGKVTGTELISEGKVKINFYVFSEYSKKLNSDSQIMVFRPFVIGEKVLDLQMGDVGKQALAPGSEIRSQDSVDLMDILSGKKMGSFLASFDHLAKSLAVVGEAFSDGKRAKEFVELVDRLQPLVKNLNQMSLEMTKVTTVALKKNRLEDVMSNLAIVSKELGVMVPAISAEVPDVGRQMGQVVDNLNVLTTEFKKMTPAIATLAPDLPRTTLRAVEALDEAVVLLKAMQKSFLLRGKVKEVLEEEQRTPANAE